MNNKAALQNTFDSNQQVKYKTTYTLDSTFTLPKMATGTNYNIPLTAILSKLTLYRHFKKKGYLISDKLPDKLSESDYNKMSVEYDTTYLLDSDNNYIKGIVNYWLAPIGSSGHCWQPHKAVITKTEKGYKIKNEDFIPTNFCIDSITAVGNKVLIAGYDYDCGNNQVVRNIRLTIE